MTTTTTPLPGAAGYPPQPPQPGQPGAGNPSTDEPWLETAADQPAKISVFDILVVAARHRWVIVGSMIVFAVLFVVVATLTPKMYESSVTLLPPQQLASRGIGGSIQDLSAALSSAEGFAFKSSEDFWTSVMRGRVITDDVIRRVSLMDVYHARSLSQAENVLRSRVSFDIDKAGLLTVIARDTKPQRAQDIANAYIDSMHDTMVHMALSDAAQRQEFFNAQVDRERQAEDEAEKQLLEVQRKTGVLELGAQTTEAIAQISDLKARIMSSTIQLQALHASATDINPQVERLRTEIGADQAALSKAESLQLRSGALGDIGASSVPQATLDYIHAQRDVRYHESLVDALTRQVEAANLDTARSAPSIQIVDPAVTPDHPSGIGRLFMGVIGLIVGFVVGIVLAALRQFYWSVKGSREGAARLAELRATLKGQA